MEIPFTFLRYLFLIHIVSEFEVIAMGAPLAPMNLHTWYNVIFPHLLARCNLGLLTQPSINNVNAFISGCNNLVSNVYEYISGGNNVRNFGYLF